MSAGIFINLAFRDLLMSVVESVRRHWSAMLTLIGVLLCGFAMEHYDAQFPWLVTAQLKSHTWLSRFDPRVPAVERVTVIEIDDDAFWQHLGGTLPTDRSFLGRLVRTAAGDNPAHLAASVIALDIRLISPYAGGGDAPEREAQNLDLFKAVDYATQNGRTVVLGAGLYDHASKREPNILQDENWPKGTRVGFLNLPHDHRLIPLAISRPEHLRSLSLEAAHAYTDVKSLPALDTVIASALSEGDLVGGFLPRESFPSAAALDVVGNVRDTLKKLDGRIVLIGSTWHESGHGRGKVVDSYDTPVGTLPGVYLHANYIESLLDRRFQRPTPGWAAAALDLLLGLALIVSFAHIRNRNWRWVLLGVFPAPVLMAYIFAVHAAVYLDFVLPVLLLVIHLAIENYVHSSKKHESEVPHDVAAA
jgi:CHASE2 domain-containing sensor protein